MNCRDGRMTDLGGSLSRVGAQHNHVDRLVAAELLRRGDCFPRGAMQLAALLLSNDQDHPMTLASLFSRGGPSAPLLAARLRGPFAPRRSGLIRLPSLLPLIS